MLVLHGILLMRKIMKTNRGALELGQYFQLVQEGAKLVGVGPSQFSLLLSGKRKPSIEIAANIEKHFGVPCRYWMEEVTIESKKKRDKK